MLNACMEAEEHDFIQEVQYERIGSRKDYHNRCYNRLHEVQVCAKTSNRRCFKASTTEEILYYFGVFGILFF